MSSSLISSRNAPAKATELHAKASPDFAAKLAETEALLQRAAADFQPLTQASSLGAEDVVITHIINRLQLDIPVFVLETGALHTETLALLERTLAHSRTPVDWFKVGTSWAEKVEIVGGPRLVEKLGEYAVAAKAQLAELPQGPANEALVRLVDYTIERVG